MTMYGEWSVMTTGMIMTAGWSVASLDTGIFVDSKEFQFQSLGKAEI